MVDQPHRTLMSVEDYLALDRNSVEARYEYIDGYAYMMSGGTLHLFGPGDQVELTSLNIAFPISALYENVTFPENTTDEPS